MAQGATRTLTDTAAGTILGPGVSSVLVNGFSVSVLGSAVAGTGENQHAGEAMLIGGPRSGLAGGQPVIKQGDPATCGHTSTGSSNVLIG